LKKEHKTDGDSMFFIGISQFSPSRNVNTYPNIGA